SLRLLGEVHRRQLEHVELGRALRPRDHQPPAKWADALEHAGHVAFGIVAVRKRLIFIAEREAAEEHQPRRIVVLPQPARGPLAVATPFHASDFSGGPTSTLGRTPDPDRGLPVSQPVNDAARAAPIRMKVPSRATGKSGPPLKPSLLTDSPVALFQPTCRLPA